MSDLGMPLQETQRLTWIDAARGFAIFGIFIVNTPAFNAPFFLYGGESIYWNTPVDRVIQAIIDIFFQASFYTLFSFLFGFGIQIMADRLKERQLPYKRIIFRRLLLLICIGLIHAFLIWHGDILLSYGIIGMFLFFFLRISTKALLFWGFGMLATISLLITGVLYLSRNQIEEQVNRQAINESFANYGTGSLADIWRQNYQDWMYVNGGEGYLFLMFSLLPLFLFGMYTARKRWLHDLTLHTPLLKKIWLAALLLFLIFKAGSYLIGNPFWLSYIQDSIGGTASAVFYLFTIALLYARGNQFAAPLVYVGRMALTNYLLQSCISFILYYSVGFGLYGSVRPVWSVAIVIGVFMLQVASSYWWLKHFRYGPMEWLWRSLTYGEKQKMKRTANE